MRTRSAQYMRDLLGATGGYQFDAESVGDWELSAAGAELDRLSDELNALFDDVFVQKAAELCLNLWESCLRPQRSTATIEQRRKMLHQQLAVNPGKKTLDEYKDMIYAAGVHGRVTESSGGLTVLCAGLLGLTEAEAKKELDALLPAHLSWNMEPVFEWGTMEASGRTFAEWDALDHSWAELDALTREEILEKGETYGIN